MMPDRPSPIDCACGLIVDQGKVLLGLRAPVDDLYPGVWDIFGGHVEGAESLEQALSRELGEELGIRPIDPVHMTTLPEPNPAMNGHRLYHVYKVTAWSGGIPRRLGNEHTEIRWFAPADAMSLALALPEYRGLLRQVG